MKLKRVIILLLIVGIFVVKGVNHFIKTSVDAFGESIDSFDESLCDNEELLQKVEQANLFIGEISSKIGVSLGEVKVANVLEAKVHNEATKRISHILYDTEYNCYFSIDMKKLNYYVQDSGVVVVEYDLTDSISVVSKKVKSQKLKDECEVMLNGGFFEKLRHSRELDISEAKGLFDAHREYICNKVVRLEEVQKNMESSLRNSILILAEAMNVEVEFKNVTNIKSDFEYSNEIQDRDLILMD